jgi:hypothetical protein
VDESGEAQASVQQRMMASCALWRCCCCWVFLGSWVAPALDRHHFVKRPLLFAVLGLLVASEYRYWADSSLLVTTMVVTSGQMPASRLLVY